MDLPEDELDLQMLLDERGGETLRRLHRLVRRGYVADLGRTDVEDAIFLNHLGEGPPLILYGDGKLVAINGCAVLDTLAGEDKDRIYNEDKRNAATFANGCRPLRSQPGGRGRDHGVNRTCTYQAASSCTCSRRLGLASWLSGGGTRSPNKARAAWGNTAGDQTWTTKNDPKQRWPPSSQHGAASSWWFSS